MRWLFALRSKDPVGYIAKALRRIIACSLCRRMLLLMSPCGVCVVGCVGCVGGWFFVWVVDGMVVSCGHVVCSVCVVVRRCWICGGGPAHGPTLGGTRGFPTPSWALAWPSRMASAAVSCVRRGVRQRPTRQRRGALGLTRTPLRVLVARQCCVATTSAVGVVVAGG